MEGREVNNGDRHDEIGISRFEQAKCKKLFFELRVRIGFTRNEL